jgi:hypothetical protein
LPNQPTPKKKKKKKGLLQETLSLESGTRLVSSSLRIKCDSQASHLRWRSLSHDLSFASQSSMFFTRSSFRLSSKSCCSMKKFHRLQLFPISFSRFVLFCDFLPFLFYTSIFSLFLRKR